MFIPSIFTRKLPTPQAYPSLLLNPDRQQFPAQNLATAFTNRLNLRCSGARQEGFDPAWDGRISCLRSSQNRKEGRQNNARTAKNQSYEQWPETSKHAKTLHRDALHPYFIITVFRQWGSSTQSIHSWEVTTLPVFPRLSVSTTMLSSCVINTVLSHSTHSIENNSTVTSHTTWRQLWRQWKNSLVGGQSWRIQICQNTGLHVHGSRILPNSFSYHFQLIAMLWFLGKKL